MANKRGQNGFLGVLIAVGLIFCVQAGIQESIGTALPIAVVIGIIVLVLLYKKQKQRKRIEYLNGKYADPTIVDHILNHRFWQGQTAEQLLDSLGYPHGMDKKLLKTMKREVWKYNPRGTNRYGLRLTLDNDVVSSWDQKQ